MKEFAGLVATFLANHLGADGNLLVQIHIEPYVVYITEPTRNGPLLSRPTDDICHLQEKLKFSALDLWPLDFVKDARQKLAEMKDFLAPQWELQQLKLL